MSAASQHRPLITKATKRGKPILRVRVDISFTVDFPGEMPPGLIDEYMRHAADRVMNYALSQAQQEEKDHQQ